MNKSSKFVKISKKSEGLPLNVVIIAVIVIVAAVILLAVFTNLFKKEGKEIDTKIRGLADCDQDGTSDLLDSCPCADEEPDEKGCCPSGNILDGECPKDKAPTCKKKRGC